VLLDPFRGMGVRRNSTETQQSGHAPSSGPEVKMEEVVHDAPKRLKYGIIQNEVSGEYILLYAGQSKRNILFTTKELTTAIS